jgi:hypothetical protein
MFTKNLNPRNISELVGRGQNFPDTDITVGMCREETVLVNRDLS